MKANNSKNGQKYGMDSVSDNPLYHDTWKLLKNYRDVVWSLELSVSQIKTQFQIEYGTSIDDFLDTIYLAGANISGTNFEHQAQCIERSNKMLKLVDSSVEILRSKHKNGESYYWILYYSFLSAQQLQNVEEILAELAPHVKGITYRTYYRKRREAIESLGAVLWGYTSKECMEILENFFPNKK